jgi:hypothetical protein
MLFIIAIFVYTVNEKAQLILSQILTEAI